MRPEIKIYISSKLEYAAEIRALNIDGIHLNGRWIHTAADARRRLVPVTHWKRENYDDIEAAHYFLMYVKPGDHLKGSLEEVGYAIGVGKQCWVAGDGHGVEIHPDDAPEDTTRTVPHRDILPWADFRQQVRICMSLEQAFAEIKSLHKPQAMDSSGKIIRPPQFHELG